MGHTPPQERSGAGMAEGTGVGSLARVARARVDGTGITATARDRTEDVVLQRYDSRGMCTQTGAFLLAQAQEIVLISPGAGNVKLFLHRSNPSLHRTGPF